MPRAPRPPAPHAPPTARPLLIATDLVYRTPADATVLDHISVSLHARRAGLVGRNGVGKTTLARILAGELAPASGAVHRPARTAYLPQTFDHPTDHTLARLLGAATDDPLLSRPAAAWLSRLGLAHIDPAAQLRALSGGEQTRAVLASLLAHEPELLILDEPTNNLDAPARDLLCDLITSRRPPLGTLVITHDRRLLSLMDEILELTPRSVRTYGGNYDVYARQSAAERAAAEHDVEHAAGALRAARRTAQAAHERQTRRQSRGKADRASSGIPKIVLNARRDAAQRTTARLTEVHAQRTDSALAGLAAAKDRLGHDRSLDIPITPVHIPRSKPILEVEDLRFRHADHSPELFGGLTLRLTGPERLAISAPSGRGKTTLLRLITGDLAPLSGRVRVSADRVAMLDQHAAILRPHESIVENFRRINPDLRDNDARAVLARFLFRNAAADRPAGTLSGGERLRAALACTLAGPHPPSLLILDEPTNHLDLHSLDNLEAALRTYTGALLVVSHDEHFLSAVRIDRTVPLPPQHPSPH